jgi:hypothetical protein
MKLFFAVSLAGIITVLGFQLPKVVEHRNGECIGRISELNRKLEDSIAVDHLILRTIFIIEHSLY